MFEVPAYSSDPVKRQQEMGEMLKWYARAKRAAMDIVEQELTANVQHIVEELDFNIISNRKSISKAIESAIARDRVGMLDLLVPKYKITANGDWENPAKDDEKDEIYWPFVPDAVARGSTGALKYLLDAGASIDNLGKQGKPLLIVALYRYMIVPDLRSLYLSHEKATEIATVLLDHGADPRERHRHYGSALSIARVASNEIDPDLLGKIETAAARLDVARPLPRRGILARLAA